MVNLADGHYYRLQILIQPRRIKGCDFCGAALRGWFLGSIYESKELRNYFFDRKYDVMPFFIYPLETEDGIYLNIIFLKAEYERMRALVDAVASNTGKKVKGTDFMAKRVILTEELFPQITANNELTAEFVTPLSLKVKNIARFAPLFNELIVAGVRSFNRYAKYYFEDAYPFKVSKEMREVQSEILNFDYKIVNEEYKNNLGRRIFLKGIVGNASYRLEIDSKHLEELSQILSILNVIQIGKHISYCFGKLTIHPVKP